ncbi:MAG: hypothetical protein E7774_02865 [Bradyrhizobium sp.]|nr:MAG: hypothetical protein E7774_02865 [Bradyrhizobium sp.]
MTQLILDRRNVLRTGGAALFLALSGGMLRAANSAGRPLPEGDAYAPWSLWSDPSIRNTPMALVAAGVIAANPHDTQPWLFAVTEDSIEIYADTSRHLGAMDPYIREMHLGLGCAIENMLTAAGPNGYVAELEVAPGSLVDLTERSRPILAARLRLTRIAGAAPDPRYAAIPARHTNRYAYDLARDPPQDWREFTRALGADGEIKIFLFDAASPQRQLFDESVVEATEAIIADKPMIADSDRWFRASSREIDAHRDGPTLDAAGLSTFTLIFAHLFSVSPETAQRAWLDQTRNVQLATAPVAGLIAVRDRYDRPSAIEAGRIWQRLHLDATLRGIALQPLNQPIEMIDRERQTGAGSAWARRVAGLTGEDWQATFAFRAGYSPTKASASPRRRLGDVVRS